MFLDNPFRDPDDKTLYCYPGYHILSVMQGRDISLRIGGGVPISIAALADHGWTLTVRHNPYGGRSRYIFRSADQRSTMMFRLNRTYRYLSLLEALDMLSEETGTVTSIPKPIPAAITDEELLTQVHRNIKRRLVSKAKKRPVKQGVIERAIAFAAA